MATCPLFWGRRVWFLWSSCNSGIGGDPSSNIRIWFALLSYRKIHLLYSGNTGQSLIGNPQSPGHLWCWGLGVWPVPEAHEAEGLGYWLQGTEIWGRCPWFWAAAGPGPLRCGLPVAHADCSEKWLHWEAILVVALRSNRRHQTSKSVSFPFVLFFFLKKKKRCFQSWLQRIGKCLAGLVSCLHSF